MPLTAVKNNLFDYLAEGIPFYLITDIWVCQDLMHMRNLAHDIFLAWNLGRRLFCLPAEDVYKRQSRIRRLMAPCFEGWLWSQRMMSASVWMFSFI